MLRQGWAIWIGMLVAGPAMAQPPADGERYPPAPELPGVVVSKPSGARPTVTVTAMSIKPVAHQLPASAPLAPAPTTSQLPYANEATTQVIPVGGVGMGLPPGPLVPVPGMMAPATMSGGCGTPACGGDSGLGFPSAGKIAEWFNFHSTSTQTGCYPSAHTPPLTAWFPCKPRAGCSSCAAPAAGCAGGNCGGSIIPVGPVDVSGGSSIRPVVNLDMRPVAGQGPVVPQADPLANFRKLDGLSFTPGGSPMAAPMSRAK